MSRLQEEAVGLESKQEWNHPDFFGLEISCDRGIHAYILIYWRIKFVKIMYDNSVRTSRRTNFVFIIKRDRLKRCRKIIVAIYCDNHTKEIHATCQKAQSVKVEVDFVWINGQPFVVLCKDVFSQPHRWRVYICGLRKCVEGVLFDFLKRMSTFQTL